MKFVLGKSHPLVESDWYVMIDDSSADLIVGLMQEGCKSRCEMLAVHDLKSTRVKTISLNVLGVYTRAACDAPYIISKRFGWFANRNGGMCRDLHEVEAEVEDSEWPKKWTPQELYETVKVSQWYGGKHYYAKLADGRDVEWGGLRKWSSAKKALRATARFLGVEDN